MSRWSAIRQGNQIKKAPSLPDCRSTTAVTGLGINTSEGKLSRYSSLWRRQIETAHLIRCAGINSVMREGRGFYLTISFQAGITEEVNGSCEGHMVDSQMGKNVHIGTENV